MCRKSKARRNPMETPEPKAKSAVGVSKDSTITPKQGRFNWLILALTVPSAINSTISVLRLLKPTVHHVSPVHVFVFLLLAITVGVYLCLSLLWRLLRKLDRYVSTPLLLAFAVGIILAGRWIPPASITTGVTITYPGNNSVVGSKVIARGTANDGNATVWVIVHPMLTDGYWVQSQSAVGRDHTWATRACFGASDDFQMIAVLDPIEELRPGLVLADWPKAKARSQIVMVKKP
jgi:hypothetical protein